MHILCCTKTTVPALPSHRGPGKTVFISKHCAQALSGPLSFNLRTITLDLLPYSLRLVLGWCTTIDYDYVHANSHVGSGNVLIVYHCSWSSTGFYVYVNVMTFHIKQHFHFKPISLSPNLYYFFGDVYPCFVDI